MCRYITDSAKFPMRGCSEEYVSPLGQSVCTQWLSILTIGILQRSRSPGSASTLTHSQPRSFSQACPASVNPYHSVVLEDKSAYIPGMASSHLPRPDSLLLLEDFMELFTEQMRPLANNQTPILGSVWQQIDKTLQTAEPWLCRVLVLMWPWGIRLDIFPVWKADVDRVKRDYQILRIVNLFKCSDYFRLLPHSPCEGFMGDCVT